MATPTLLHTMTTVPADSRWLAFQLASAGGGSPPEWTDQSPDDPEVWSPPIDAAGGLLLFRHGRYVSLPVNSARNVGIAIATAAQVLDLVDWCVLHAAYYSAGGRGVFLLHVRETGEWIVAVARSEEVSRVGVSEENITARIPEAVIAVIGPVIV